MSEYVSVAMHGPSAAFFDLDRTLIAGSSAFALGKAARKMKLMPTGALIRDGVSAASFKLFGAASDEKADAARDRILGFITGHRQDELRALNEQVIPALLGKIRPEARRLVDLHRNAGRNTYIVSAAPHEIVDPLAHAAGMTAGLGTKGELVDGIYTGDLDGPFCYGQGKVEAMREIARWDHLDLAQCYAYSDSASDLPMLEAVGHPVVVNPDSTLERHARRNGWPIVHFRQRTKTVIRRTMVGVGTASVAAATFAAGLELGTRRAGRLTLARR